MLSPAATARDEKFGKRFRKRFSFRPRDGASSHGEGNEDLPVTKTNPSTHSLGLQAGTTSHRQLPAIRVEQCDTTRPERDRSQGDGHLSRRDSVRQTAHAQPVPTPASASPSYFNNASRFVLNDPTFVTNVNRRSPSPSESVAFKMFKGRTATSAMHNSAERFDPPKCDDDTRVGLLEEIMTWIGDPASSSIAVITGPAGSGKSAIQQTVAEICAQQNSLAGSFFFSVSDQTRNKHHYLFTTLIYQIAQTNKELRPFIEQAVKDDAAIFDRSLETQVNVLLIDPLQAANSFYTSGTPQGRWPSVLIIDGVDECRGEEMQCHFLDVIYKCFVQRKLPYKIILASRPEYAIRTALEGNLKAAYHIKLHEHDASADIKVYLRRRLRALGEASNDPQASDPSWPTDSIVDKLADNSSGQFVYAATVVKFASNHRVSPFLRIEQVLQWEPGVEQRNNPFAALDALYTNILVAAEEAYKEASDDDRSVVDLLRELMLYNQCSPFIEMSLTIPEFESFLSLRKGQIENMLSDLHSLIKTTTIENNGTPELTIVFHHKSFADYLQDPSRSSKIHRSDHLMYTRLLRSSVLWIHANNYEVIEAACTGVRSKNPSEGTKEHYRLVRFSMCYWVVYLFKCLILDVDSKGGPSPAIPRILDKFLASRGWLVMKQYIRKGGLFRSPDQPFQHIRGDVLEEIWSWYISQCLVFDSLSDRQRAELRTMLDCIEMSRQRPHTSDQQMKAYPPIMIAPIPEETRHPLGDRNFVLCDRPPPGVRTIALSYPPKLSTSLMSKPATDESGDDTGRWSASPHLESGTLSDPDGWRNSVLSGSSRRESEYHSCPSTFGSEGDSDRDVGDLGEGEHGEEESVVIDLRTRSRRT